MLRLTCILLFASVFIASNGQKHIMDSLLKAVATTPVHRLDELYLDIAIAATDTSYHEALRYARLASRIATLEGDSVNIVRSGRLTAQMLRALGKMDSAKFMYLNLLPMARRQNLHNDEYILLNALGILHAYQANYHEALEIFYLCIDKARALRSDDYLFSAQQNMGLVFYKVNDFSSSLAFYEGAKRFVQGRRYKERVGELMCQMALCYVYLGDRLKAQAVWMRRF
jgi:tetratricopeptide (TPR) repeat protein